MRRPPLAVVVVAIAMITLAETAGALMSQLRPQIQRYASQRVARNPQVHGLVGSAEYDGEVTSRTVFTAEAGLSFFHTHGEGLGIVLLLAATVVATAVSSAGARALLHSLLAIGTLFPLGYLAYSALALELGRERGVELAEQAILTPLGAAAILGLAGTAIALWSRRRNRLDDAAGPGAS